jgi:hypothetical protein
MQHTMKYDPVQLICVGSLVCSCILLYPLGAYIYFALQVVPVFTQVEGDDIGIGIMRKKAVVHLQQKIIVAKYIA